MDLKNLINHVKDANPYPTDIFPEPSDTDWKGLGEFLLSHGRNPDRIFAKWGRMVWNNCIDCIESYIEVK